MGGTALVSNSQLVGTDYLGAVLLFAEPVSWEGFAGP